MKMINPEKSSMQDERLPRSFINLALSALITMSLACSSDSDSDPDNTEPNIPGSQTVNNPGAGGTPAATTNTSTTANSISDVLSANKLALAVPIDLSISLLPNSSTSLSLAKTTDQKSIKEKIQESQNILAGTGDSCVPAIFKETADNQEPQRCYEFDQDMMYGGELGDDDDTSRFNGTQNGKDENGEACMVSFARSKVSQVIKFVDETLGLVQAMVCQAKKANSAVDLPAVGETLDMKANLTNAMGSRISRVQAATMKRLEDVASRPIYSSLLEMEDKHGSTRTMQLVHSPDATGTNTNYNGTLYVIMNGDFGGARDGANQNKSRLMSINYAKVLGDDGTPRLKYELRTAMIHDDLRDDAITSSGQLDLNVGTEFTPGSDFGKIMKPDGGYYNQANEALSAITLVSFDINPDDSTGNISYWQNPGGNYNEPTRGMNFTLQKVNDEIKGCANSGAAGTSRNNSTALAQEAAGLSIRRALKETLVLKPQGYWHPFLNDTNGLTSPAGGSSDSVGTYHTRTDANTGQDKFLKWYKPALSNDSYATTFYEDSEGNLTTRQCFKKNATSGVYEIDTEVITEDAGYELVPNTDTANKIIAPPNLSDVAPLDATFKESVNEQ